MIHHSAGVLSVPVQQEIIRWARRLQKTRPEGRVEEPAGHDPNQKKNWNSFTPRENAHALWNIQGHRHRVTTPSPAGRGNHEVLALYRVQVERAHNRIYRVVDGAGARPQYRRRSA